MEVLLDNTSRVAGYEEFRTAGNTALEHFLEWDENRNGTLSQDELAKVSLCSNTKEERESADLLTLNFDSARELSQAGREDVGGLSWRSRDCLESAFYNDWQSTGISRKDLVALDMLASSSGLYTFSQKVEANKRNGLISDGSVVGLSVIMGGLLVRKTLMGKGTLDTKLLIGAAAIQAICWGIQFANGFTDDLSVMEEQFKRRQAMLDSWNKQ
jgi:hypothetical protein